MKRILLVIIIEMLTGSLHATYFGNPKKIELTDEEKALVSNLNTFAVSLFQNARGSESIILSPLSITTALGMVNNGAEGVTLQEISTLLGAGELGADEINSLLKKILTESCELDENVKLLMANNLFFNKAREDLKLKSRFVETLNNYYGVSPMMLDFREDQTLDVINQWGKECTEGQVEQILDRDSFDPSLVCYLLNTLCFKAPWTFKFDKRRTTEEPFDGGKCIVPMMFNQESMFYTENDDFQAVLLPFATTAFQMTVLLPREGKNLNDVLNATKDNYWWSLGDLSLGDKQNTVRLKIPSFKTCTDIELNGILSSMGMPNAFQNGHGFYDLCYENDNEANSHRLYIDLVKQSATINVNEKGCEAAAITSINMTDGGGDYREFIANRPFIYVITERSTNTIFFIGQYMGETNSTDITNHQMSDKTDYGTVYDLNGHSLNNIPEKGIYIKGGKKYVNSK